MSLAKKFNIKPSDTVKLKRFDPGYSKGHSKEEAERKVLSNANKLFEQQTLLYAENRRALLIVLQGMDSAGKDGVIRHVMRGLNPQGCTVTPFKAPSDEERDHDYLWRIHKNVPARGDIAIFNRSHYEDVLITRVKGFVSKAECELRYDEINDFERMLSNNGVTIVKFFLHISKDEQRERLQKRLDDPLKNWKFNENDLKERGLWKEYVEAYETMLNHCSTAEAPWYIIPSDKKWFRNLAVSEILIHTFKKMNLKWPKPSTDLKRLKVS